MAGLLSRSHALRGNAISDAPRLVRDAERQDGIPTRSVGTSKMCSDQFAFAGVWMRESGCGWKRSLATLHWPGRLK